MGTEPSLVAELFAASHGDGGAPAELLVRIDGTNRAETAIGIADSMVSVPGLVAVVGHSNSAASLAASQIYNRAEVVQLAPHSTAAFYSRAGPYSFRMVASDERQGAFLAERLKEEWDSARVAVLYVNDDYGRGLRTSFLDALKSERYPVVLRLPHVEDQVDSALVARTVRSLETADPDVLVWLGRGSILQRHLESIRARLGQIPVWGSDAAGQVTSITGRGGEWSGVRFADFAYPDDTPAFRAFREESRRRLGRDPQAVEVLTRDAVAVLLEGIRSGARSGPELQRYLLSLGRERPPFDGLSGPVSFEPDGDMDRAYVLRTISIEEGIP